MNKTYRILPSAEDMLLRLLRGLALSDEERALLRACALRHVEVSAEENTWELVIGTPTVLDEELLTAIARQVETNYALAGAFVQQNVIALKGAEPALREKIFKNMSSRAAESLKEDLESRGPVRLSEVEAQQKEILKTVKRLADEGTIVVSSGGADALV